MRKLIALVAAAVWLAAWPAAAQEGEGGEVETPDPTEYSDSGFGMDISAYGIVNFGWHVSVGAGAQFAYPVVPNGFIPSPRFRDALHIEGGLDFGYYFWTGAGYDYHVGFLNPMAGVRYAVYVLESLAPFATLKLGAAIPTVSGGSGYDPSVYFYMVGTVGVLWDLTDFMALRAEVGYQYVGHSSDVWKIGLLFRL